MWPCLQVACNFQEQFRGCFLRVLNMEFLSLVAAAFLIPIFYIKAMSAVTCCRSTGVQVCLVHLCLGQRILRGVPHATWIALNVFLFPHPAMRTLMHWMGEMMEWESSKQFWLWLLLFWRILGKHCSLFEFHDFCPFTSTTSVFFSYRKERGKELQKCPSLPHVIMPIFKMSYICHI